MSPRYRSRLAIRRRGSQPLVALLVTLVAALATACGGGDEEAATTAETEAARTSATQESTSASECASEATVLFWPKGHPAIPAINFPALPMPHIEVYKGTGPAYPMSAAIAWAFASSPGPGFPQRQTSPQCLASGSTDSGQVSNAKTVQAAARLVCTAESGIQIRIEELSSSRYRLDVQTGTGELTAQALVAPRGSSASYATEGCEESAPPQP